MKPKKSISWTVILIGAILVLSALGASAKEEKSSAIPKAEALSKISKLHIPFIANRGQMDEKVKYYARTFGGTVYVSEAGEISYSFPRRNGEGKTLRGWVLKEEVLGGCIKGIEAEEESPTRVSYFVGDDASRWRSDLSTYGTVSLGEVYEGIEVKLKAYGKSVEKLFYVRAGAEPQVVRLRLSGAESLRVNGEGELEVRTGLGEVKFSKPVAYQEIEGKRRYVEVSYQVEGNEYGFKLRDYDRGRELVIDPVLQSSYLGGPGNDTAYSIAIDSGGNVYVAGKTEASYGVDDDAFVFKLNSALTKILQFTFLGGSNDDYANSIAIGSGGNVYVAGFTWSNDFPGTAGGAQPSLSGIADAFVTKLNSTLTTVVQSTYLGGSVGDDAYSIDIDSAGNVYVAGYTSSTDLPVSAGGAQSSYGGGGDAFVSKLNPSLTKILQSTYLGGSGMEQLSSIAIGSGGNIYVAGYTPSTNFPGTQGGAQTSNGGYQDGFVARLNPDLTKILQSTYLGGNNSDLASSLAIGSGGNVYVAGFTQSTNFPVTAGAAQTSYNGGEVDGFVARLNPDLTDLVQSTYLGGGHVDQVRSIAIDSDGDVYVTGLTGSTNFPGTIGSPQPLKSGDFDAFVARLNLALTGILQSTYLGGSGADYGFFIAIGSGGNVYVAGETTSTNFPGMAGGAQPSYNAYSDAFVARFYSGLTELPGAATLVSPSGPVTTPTPTYSWNAVALAAEYDLRVNDSTGNRILQWYSASEAGCPFGTGICSVTPATALAAGPGKWWIQAKNSAGTGPLSSPLSFKVEGVSTPSVPEGPKNAETNAPYAYTYTVRGSTSSVGDSVQYLFNWGDGSDSGWRPPGTMIASHSWASSGTYKVKAQARCAAHDSIISPWSKTLSVTVETVSAPRTPSGITSGTAGVGSVYSTGDSTSGSGHPVQYLFDWGNGTDSGWLPVGKTSASKSWALPGGYRVRAKARCSTHNLIISDWSSGLEVSMHKITVVRPNGGEVIPSGSRYTIEWTAAADDKVSYKILYSTDNGSTWTLIPDFATGTSYDWTVPTPLGNKNSCLVKVTGYNVDNVKIGEDRSDKPFRIEVVKLFRPNAPVAGEILRSGLSYPIEWAVNGTESPVTTQKLYYSMDGGSTWSLITTLDGAPRTYSWTVPIPPGNKNNCYVKVVAYSGNKVVGSDRSAKPFTIQGVQLMRPNDPRGGEILRSAQYYRIWWEIYGTNSPVTTQKVYYSMDGGVTWSLIKALDGLSRSCDWEVPTLTSNKTNCYVKVVAYSENTVVGSDRSIKPFTIEVVRLRAPNDPGGREVLISGDRYTIWWDVNKTKSPVTTQKLYYTMNGGATWSLISELDPGARSYEWTVPTPPANTTNCYVKVVAYSGSTVVGSDRSVKPFTIQVVRLLWPNGGEVYESGRYYQMWWEVYGTKYPVATVKLYYSMDGGTTWSLITTLDGSFRSYDWLPLAQTTKTKCKVKVAISYTTGIATATDISDGYFTIQP